VLIKKNILWVAHESNLSGANIALLEYIDVLNDSYNFHVILPHAGSMEFALKNRNVAYSIVAQYSWVGDRKWWELNKLFKIAFRSLSAISATKKIIKQQQIAIVFTNTITSFTGAVAAHQLSKPHIWWIHEFGEEDFGFKIGWGNQQWAFRKIQQWSNLIIANSDSIANKFKKIMPGALIKRLYQPVCWDESQIADTLFKGDFLMFGQIIPSKGHREVLAALAKIRESGKPFNATLHIQGPSENKEYLDELIYFIQQNQLQNIVTIETGFFKKETVIPLYKVLIIASQSEAFGRVIVEANKAGLSVIVKNSGGAPELINSTNGILYNDVNELADILGKQNTLTTGICKQNYSEQEEIATLKNWLAAY
jgi:glycosyltransferase involved in cell wall biosynthesis